MSIRINSGDVAKVKRLAQRLGVRDSDIVRFALKTMLQRLVPLTDPDVRGRNLVPVFVESGVELLRYFDLDAARLEAIINDSTGNERRVEREDIALLALSGSQDPYAAIKLSELNHQDDQLLRNGELSSSLRRYLYEKYVYRGNNVRRQRRRDRRAAAPRHGERNMMFRTLRASTAVLALCLMLAPRADADPVGPTPLVESSVMVAGSHSSLYTLDVSGPGVLTVRLENISWPERLSQLDCAITSSSGLLDSFSNSGEWKFVTTGPASFYASIIAGAGGRLNLGLFSIRVTFEWAASVVPLPAAVWLLGSVLGLFGLRRAWPAMRFAFFREQFA